MSAFGGKADIASIGVVVRRGASASWCEYTRWVHKIKTRIQKLQSFQWFEQTNANPATPTIT